jgi:signal transduction histidine kinase
MKPPNFETITMMGMKLGHQPRLVKWGIVFGATVIYWIIAARLIPFVGDGILIGAILPVIAAGWFFGAAGGVTSSFLSIIISIAIMLMFGGSTWNNVFSSELLFGNCMVLLVGVITGRLRHNFEARLQSESQLRSRELYLTLLNEMTRTIITAQDFNTMMQTLVNDLTNLLTGDTCYITRWDPIKDQVFPVATNAGADHPFLKLNYPKGEKNLTTSALEAGHVLIVEDALKTGLSSLQLIRKFTEKSFISIPLIYGEHKLGAAIIGFEKSRQFTQAEIKHAHQASNQIALALWNAQQDLELKKHLQEVETLAHIAHALSETERIGLQTVLQLIVTSAQELIPGAEQAVIHLLDTEQQFLLARAVSGYDDSASSWKSIRIRPNEGIAGQVFVSGQTINIADIEKDSRYVAYVESPKYRSLMVAPVQSGEQKLGTISVQSVLVSAFTDAENRLLSALGTQAAIAIENARLLETTRQGLKEVNALYRITKGLAVSLETEQLMKDVVNLLQQNFGYYQVEIYIIAPQSEELVMQNGSGKIGELLRGKPMPAGAGIVGHTAETGEPFFTNDVDRVVFFVPNPLLPDTKSELAMPIKVNNRVLGVLDIQQCLPGRLTERDLQLVSTVAEQLAVALQKADLYSNLQTSLQQEKAVRSQLIQSDRLALVGRLLASVSHELNNPLQAIQNALFLLKEERGISAQGQQDLQIVLSEAERMATLIERLSASYRPTRKEDFQSIQLNTVVEDVYALVATHLRHNQITFEFHPNPDLPPVLGLPDQLRQVVLNLLMNAVEAMPNGGHLTISTDCTGEKEACISVSDTGPGIDPEIMHSIFDPFVTNKETGTGLGLTITYDIIHRHNGRIIAENAPNGGAIFTFWIPAIAKEFT